MVPHVVVRIDGESASSTTSTWTQRDALKLLKQKSEINDNFKRKSLPQLPPNPQHF